jgi:NADH-quinone oxidoreductase subunit A
MYSHCYWLGASFSWICARSWRKIRSQTLSFECGFDAFEDSRMKFDVRYYLVAILFIVFDLEIAFLFPWAVALDTIGVFGIVAMLIFLGVLVVGFIYEWKKGALEWD